MVNLLGELDGMNPRLTALFEEQERALAELDRKLAKIGGLKDFLCGLGLAVVSGLLLCVFLAVVFIVAKSIV